jgi:hypothetical protein
MLADADQRRTPSKSLVKPPTSQSWSQKFSSATSKASSTESALRGDNDIPEDRGFLTSESGERDAAISIEQANIDASSDSHEHASELYQSSLRSSQQSYEEPPRESFPDVEIDQQIRDSRSVASSSIWNKDKPVDDRAEPASEEEESIEAYMQRLLNRVRGDSESSPTVASAKVPTVEPQLKTVQSASTKPRSRVAASMGIEMEEAPSPVSERLNEELFVPRQQAPEKRNDLAALRELANTNARRAITRSDIRRTNSAFFIKLGVTGLAVFSAVALFLFNGFALNAPFAGMVAAVVVAVLWGMDCVNHFKQLKNVGQNQATPAETAAGQSIRVGNSDESSWRPTPA